MTDEERQRAMDSIAARQSYEKAIEARRKLDRDMDRLERALKRTVEPNARQRSTRA